MSAAVDRVVAALTAHNCEPHEHGDGYEALCPAHDDSDPSLTINAGDDGKVLIHCHAECLTKDIVAALGMKMKDLFSDNGHGSGKGKIVATYDYQDEAGNLLYQVVRSDPKDFCQRRPDGNGGYIWKMGTTRRVIYRLPEVLAAIKAGKSIYIGEGEKDVLTLVGWKLEATCNPMGAEKWRPEYSEPLRGAHVVIIPDRDEPGRRHAEQVVASLCGVAASVRVLELPAGKDITEWRDQHGGTREELEALLSAPVPAATPPVVEDKTEIHAEVGTNVTYLHTDGGNADRFADEHRGTVKHCHPWASWLVYGGGRWQRDTRGAVMHKAKLTTRRMIDEALALDEGDPTRKAAVRWGISSDARTKRDAMLALARSEPGIPVTPDELDRDAYVLNVLNGTIDLHTGLLLPHDPGRLITKLAPVVYNPTATAPTWQACLARVLPYPAVREFWQRFVGYCLTGDESEQILLFLYGPGANGKTTVINAVMATLGDYAQTAAPDLLVQSSGDRHPTELADLMGARLVATVEVQEGRRLAEVLVKQLTGGDRIKGRWMRSDFFEFKPTHKLVLVANHKPIVKGSDYAIWRRIRLVPFSEVIPEHERDPHLPEKLQAELPGILAWAVQGCLAWQRDGLTAPEPVVEATASYKREQDSLSDFILDACEIGETLECTAAALRTAYNHWCETNGERPLTATGLGLRLEEKGFLSGRTRRSRLWYGLAPAVTRSDPVTRSNANLGMTESFDSHVGLIPKPASQRVTPPPNASPDDDVDRGEM